MTTRIVTGQVIQVGGPSMVLGDNGEVVNLDCDDYFAVGQVMATPAAKKLRRTNSDTIYILISSLHVYHESIARLRAFHVAGRARAGE